MTKAERTARAKKAAAASANVRAKKAKKPAAKGSDTSEANATTGRVDATCGIGEAIAYNVLGLPSDKRTVISTCPGGWRIVRETLVEFDQVRIYLSAEEALVALKRWTEGGEEPKG
jgi:hypothetical protein